MNKELSFDDEDDAYPTLDDESYEDDALIDSKIPVGRFAKIIDEFETFRGDFDDDDTENIDFDSLGLR